MYKLLEIYLTGSLSTWAYVVILVYTSDKLLTELFFFFCRRRVKSIPKYAAAQFYVDKCFANDKGKEYSGIKAFVRLTWVYPLSLGLRLLEIFLFTDE